MTPVTDYQLINRLLKDKDVTTASDNTVTAIIPSRRDTIPTHFMLYTTMLYSFQQRELVFRPLEL